MIQSRPTKKTRVLVAVLFALKMAITAWNSFRYPPQGGYDNFWHVARVVRGGLRAMRMDYDPPLYYFVNLPTIWLDPSATKDVDGLMTVIEYTNVLYLLLFYAAWIYVIFPRVLPSARSWALASVILLALPGYQKLAAMVHCDNILTMFTAATFAGWLWLDQRRARFESAAVGDAAGAVRAYRPYRLRALVGFAALIGFTALTRPFACLPVALFSILTLRECWAISRPRIGRFVARAAPLMILVGVMSTTWYAYRWSRSGTVLDAYYRPYIEQFQEYKKDFDYKSYFTTFHLQALVKQPNRKMFELDKGAPPGKNKYANSFFTLLYSEIWADQWLYFSGGTQREEKLWPKRVILVGAMPLTLFLIASWITGAARTVGEAVRTGRWVSARTVMLAMTLGAAALYLWWQTGPALLPGKNSSVKFIYIAYAVPFALATAMSFRMKRREYVVALPLALVTFVLALPIACYWDTPRPRHPRKLQEVEVEGPVETRLALPPPSRVPG
jgi:hypothetical protein